VRFYKIRRINSDYLEKINRLVFVKDRQFISCIVGGEFLNIMKLIFMPHTVHDIV